MTRFPNFFASLLVAILALTTSARSERHCGIALSTGHDPHLYYAWETRQVLQTMRLRRATDVQISAYSKQIGLNATTAKLVTNKAALAYIFQLAHQIGLRVFFKPVVEVETARGGYEWRGRIPGSVAWFNQVYIPFIVDMARLAQAHKLDSFAVGSEYDATVNSTQLWLRVIQSVRAVYTGKLTYIGNHDSYFKVHFWYALDYISVSAYFRLVPKNAGPVPSFNQTKVLFDKRMARLDRWRTASGLTDKDILIGEVGFQSKGGLVNFYRPWAWTAPGPLNKVLQAQMYEAFLSSYLSQPWSMGVMIWHFDLKLNAGYTYGKLGYTPQNKPAQWTMKRYFKSYCG